MNNNIDIATPSSKAQEWFRRYRQVMEQINYLCFLALLLTLPYEHYLCRPLGVAWLISWLLEFRFLGFPTLLRSTDLRRLIPIIGLCVFILWNIISISWADDTTAAWRYISRIGAMAALLPITLWGLNARYRVSTCLKALVIGSLASIFVFLFANYWVHNSEAALHYAVPRTYTFHLFGTKEMLLFMKHRHYYVMPLCLSIPAILYLLPTYIKRYGKVMSISIAAAAIAVLCLAIYLTGSREGIINLAAVITLCLFMRMPHHKRWLYIAVVTTLFCFALLGIVRWHPRFREATIKEYFEVSNDTWNPTIEPRIAIWSAALQQPSDYSLYGLGAGNSAKYLIDRYTERGWPSYVERGYGAHNNYLTVWMELGFVAMLLFIALWLLTPWCYTKKAHEGALFFVCVMMLNMTTETFLFRIEGIVLCMAGFALLEVMSMTNPIKNCL